MSAGDLPHSRSAMCRLERTVVWTFEGTWIEYVGDNDLDLAAFDVARTVDIARERAAI